MRDRNIIWISLGNMIRRSKSINLENIYQKRRKLPTKIGSMQKRIKNRTQKAAETKTSIYILIREVQFMIMQIDLKMVSTRVQWVLGQWGQYHHQKEKWPRRSLRNTKKSLTNMSIRTTNSVTSILNHLTSIWKEEIINRLKDRDRIQTVLNNFQEQEVSQEQAKRDRLKSWLLLIEDNRIVELWAHKWWVLMRINHFAF